MGGDLIQGNTRPYLHKVDTSKLLAVKTFGKCFDSSIDQLWISYKVESLVWCAFVEEITCPQNPRI
jgi:hypothetical protein